MTTGTGPEQTACGVGSMVELDVSGVAHGGWCVAREPGGRVVFVRHTLPGERVRARVTETTASFARADAVEVLTPSPDRVAAPCPYAEPGACGGCDWQHASLPAQRRLKAEVVADQLRRLAGLDWPVTVEAVPGDSDGLGWRTRVRFSVGRDGVAGLLAHRSHRVVPVMECLIAHPLVGTREVTGTRWEATAAVEVAVSPGSSERTVSAVPRQRRPRGRGRGAPGAGERPASRPVSGPSYLRQSAAGETWRVGAGTFWQVHPGAADILTSAVLGGLEPKPGDVAFDLYCGAGLFSRALAEAVGPDGTVIGVDADRAAVRDARHNLRELPWARVHAGDVAEVLARGGWPAAGLAVLDPPRTGLAREVIEHLVATPGLRRVACVSCDPATLARDIAVFAGHGWRLSGLRSFDIFPMTHHVECVAVLVPEAVPG